ncbi:MAG: TPM domain-containing protein [Clostridia bacterium]|nr:TPM domain-containing protein [Clostridia bacterium]
MKKLIPILCVFLMFVFSVQGFAYENVIDDSADLFSESEEIEILTAIEDFSDVKSFSLAVVTTDYTSCVSSEEFADDYYDYLIDNEGWQEDGVLFLIDMDNRNVWISTCGDCILAYNDSEIDSIIDRGYESLANGFYADCILNMTEAALYTDTSINSGEDHYIIEDESLFGDSFFSGSIAEHNAEIYEINENGEWVPIESDNEFYENFHNYSDSSYSSSSISFDLGNILIYILIGLAIGGISVFAVKSHYKNTGKGDECDADDLTLNLTASNDNIISRNVITTKIPKNNNHHHGGGSRGSFSGGSSVHRSGGGRSHGGGGRGF